ncbi:type 2 isopentenyl-diphosphate Delta-isomerase [Bacillus cytotoxicus]|uniref:type 2 isopentenyl-diphosphate Delta-isomerase n=1 Tax=Bacillus cytotoxicus TaxID=580165 RepID=UPI00244ADE64|nr:type 2 isopentenyl-diphosphate Delta-isomerase [Bacillus cytotoxicus]MDH2867627.1 type 2 isopentenyl-diphosphate Delta-isomerase [Bacillus cytotoxicus]
MAREKRKLEHIEYALSTGQSRTHGFCDIEFVHKSLPNSSFESVTCETKIGELSLSSPIFINAMTGGGGERTLHINEQLAYVAKHHHLAMAVGSQMAALKEKREVDSYRIVRRVNPNGIVFANLGSEATVEQAKCAVDMIEANALQIHLNVIQELTMPEGDRDFKGVLKRIENIVLTSEVPVIVKEVGFGMSKETVQQLANIGVIAIDIGGQGGTNFAAVENERRNRMLSYFNDWGIQTASSIIEASSTNNTLSLIASGGIQTALDVAKAIALGAQATAFAGYFLRILMNEGMDTLIEEVELLHTDLRFIMTALGAKNILELQQVPLVVKGDTYHWLTQRGIDTMYYSQR